MKNETNETKQQELKYFHFNADYSCEEGSQHCQHFNIDYVYCSAYVDMTIEVNDEEYHLQLQNGNSYDYGSYDCPTNTLSIYRGCGDAGFFEAIQDNDLEEIQEYDETITQEQLDELNKEFNIILNHYQEMIDEEAEEAENKKIYTRIIIKDNIFLKEIFDLTNDDEKFLNDYQNQIKDDFEAKRDEIKAKYLSAYQQENNLGDEDITNFTCKLKFKYFKDTLSDDS